MPFDIGAAKKEGYTDQNIASYLSQTRGFDYEGARREGYSDQQITEHLRHKGFVAEVADGAKSFAKGIQNIPRDVIETGIGIATALNPANWPEIGRGIGKIAVGGIQKAIPGEPERTDAVQAAEEFGKTIDPGTPELRRRMFEEHPVQTMANLSFGAGTIGGIAKGAGKITKSEALAEVGKTATDVAASTDPLNLMVRASQATGKVLVPEKLVSKIAEKAEKLPPFSREEIRRRIGKQYEPGSEYGKAQQAKNIEEANRLKAETGVDFSTAEEIYTPEAISFQQKMAPVAGEAAQGALHEKNIISRAKLDDWLDAKLTAAPDGSIPIGNVDDVRKTLTKQLDDAASMLDRRDAWAARQVRTGKAKVEKLLAGIQGKATDTPKGASEKLLNIKGELYQIVDDAVKEAYRVVPDIKLDSSELVAGLKELDADIAKRGGDYAAIASDVADMKRRLFPRSAAAEEIGLLDAYGKPIPAGTIAEAPEQINFQLLRGWKSELGKARRSVMSGQNPDHNLGRRIGIVEDALQSNMDELLKMGGQAPEAHHLYKEANAIYKDFLGRFRQGVTAETFRRGPRGEAVAGKMEEIGQEYWKGGESSIAAFKRTFGDDKKAIQSIRDVAIDDFIRNVPNPATGEISIKRLAQWQRQNKRALDAYGLKNEFANLKKTQKMLDDYVEGEKRISRAGDVARRELEQSTGARALEALPEDTIRRALTGGKYKNMQERIGELIRATENKPEALQGLKTSFRDFLKEELKGARDITGQQMGTNVKTAKVIAKYAPAIKALYGADGVKTLITYEKTLNRLNAAKQVVYPVSGSTTASNITGAASIIKDIGQLKPLSKTNFIARSLSNLIEKMNEPHIRDLMKEAMLNPEVAKTFNRAFTGADKVDVTMRKLRWHAKTLGLFEAGKVADITEEEEP